jgi:hypothetical protein
MTERIVASDGTLDMKLHQTRPEAASCRQE